MRITNKIMQRNNLANMNTNKIYQDTLSNQMATQKKVNRPSDDPVVAIRALRLRSSVTEITQYYSKNIPDAESWLNVTEDALKNLSQIVTNMIGQCTKGANGDLKTTDRQIILEQLQALGEEVYSTGDADYAGRYVFTGYRTDTSLSFVKEETKDYSITEQVDNSVIDSVIKVETDKLLDLNSGNFNDATMADINEEKISAAECYRIRLSYDDLKEGTLPSISFQEKQLPGDDYTWVTWPGGGVTIVEKHLYESPYATAAEEPDALIYVPETGELLLGKNRYEKLMATKNDVTTTNDESEIRITYSKEHWQKGDLRPEHYFKCEAEGVTYNEEYLNSGTERQDIEYDVGFNQTIRVNSTADECFKHGIRRTVDDLVNSMQEVVDLENTKSKLKELMKTAGGTDAEILQTQLDAVDKALSLAKDKGQRLFEKGITVFQGYLDDTNLSITNCGTRSSKLNLIQNRMQNQKTTFETLRSENEDIDITEVAIQLKSAGLTYEAALMATGKVMKNTLLNFI